MSKLRCTSVQAEKILKALGAEDLLYAHAGAVHTRQDTYARLAELIDEVCGTPPRREGVPRVYLAGPDVFLKNAKVHAESLKTLCAAYAMEGVFPLDADIPELASDDIPGPGKAALIYKANVALIDDCDAVLANMTPFRGPSTDAGTCWEMGYAKGIGKPVVGYTHDLRLYEQRVEPDAFDIESFQGVDNLMLTGGADAIMVARRDWAGRMALDEIRRAIEELAHLIGILPRKP